MNFLSINRKPGESIGALVADEHGKTYNIEYNIVNNFYKSRNLTEPVNSHGNCLSPGNVNCFMLEIQTYIELLD